MRSSKNNTEVVYRQQYSFVRSSHAGDPSHAKIAWTMVEGVMASKGRWSAWGADNGAALANLLQMLKLHGPPRSFASVSVGASEKS